MTKPTPAAKPAPVAGDNQRAMMIRTTDLAITAETARAALRDYVLSICTGATEGFIRDVQRAAMIGFVAASIARKAERNATADDVASAAVILAKKGKDQSEDEAKMAGAARVRWFNVMETVRKAAPEAAPAKSAAKATAAKATAAKRKARVSTASITTTKGATTKAKGSEIKPSISNAPVATSRADALAHMHQGAGHLMAFLERNDKTLGAALAKAIKPHLSAILATSAGD